MMNLHKYPINSIVIGTVFKADPYLIRVRLENGTFGILRKREIAWDEKMRQAWLDVVYPGQALLIKIIRYDHNQRPEVSLRMIENDPWDKANTRYKTGQLVRGVVRGHDRDAIFIELEPGIEGILRAEDLSFYRSKNILDTFWVGDSVYCIIQSLNLSERKLSFTFEGLRSKRWIDRPLRKYLPVRPEVSDDKLINTSHNPSNLLNRYHYIIVDDKENEQQAMSQCLRQPPSRVLFANSAKAAEMLLHKMPNNAAVIVFMDWQMAQENGDEAIKRLRPLFNHAHFILTSSGHLDPNIETQMQLVGVPILTKPAIYEDLLNVIQFVGKRDDIYQNGSSLIAKPTLKLKLDPLSSINLLLKRIKQKTNADNAILFRVDALNTQVELVTYNCDVKPNENPNLLYSPIWDVAISNQPYICNNVFESASRLQHLRPLLRFQACIGISVPTRLTDHFVIFLFYDNPQHLDLTTQDNMTSCLYLSAESIGGLLEQDYLIKPLIANQRMIVAGELSSAMTHDIAGQIGSLKNMPQMLSESLKKLQAVYLKSPPEAKKEFDYLGLKLEGLQSIVDKIANISNLYRDLSRKTSDQYLRIDKIVEQAVHLAYKTADDKEITLEFIVPNQIVIGHSQSTHLLQILQNIILNAVQQITRMTTPRPTDGRIRVSLETKSLPAEKQEDPNVVFHIRVEDNGPGIHLSECEAIFDLGVTNRIGEGSGIGLYMARTLVSQLGGRVVIEESAIGWGSCFLIELPS